MRLDVISKGINNVTSQEMKQSRERKHERNSQCYIRKTRKVYSLASQMNNVFQGECC